MSSTTRTFERVYEFLILNSKFLIGTLLLSLSPVSVVPATGEHVRVKGRVQDVAIVGGRPLGLHLREQDLYVKR